MYEAVQQNGAAVQYMERFLNRYLPDLRTFRYLHREMHSSGSFYVSMSDTGTEIYRRIYAMEENNIMHSILCRNGLRESRERWTCAGC